MDIDAYIGLGSNQGDRELNLLRAVAETGKLPSSRVTGLSPFYETSPVGVTDQPSFYNAVLRLSTRLSPLELLNSLMNIENNIFKRKRTVRWGPRPIDLDLLLYGDQIMETNELTIPHPRMAERRFVLQPLNVLAPDLRHPASGIKISELLEKLNSDEIVRQV